MNCHCKGHANMLVQQATVNTDSKQWHSCWSLNFGITYNFLGMSAMKWQEKSPIHFKYVLAHIWTKEILIFILQVIQPTQLFSILVLMTVSLFIYWVNEPQQDILCQNNADQIFSKFHLSALCKNLTTGFNGVYSQKTTICTLHKDQHKFLCITIE
jgi:hypothetical protein